MASCCHPRKPQVSIIRRCADNPWIRASITPIATCDRQTISLLLLVPADKSWLPLTDGTMPPEIDCPCSPHWRRNSRNLTDRCNLPVKLRLRRPAGFHSLLFSLAVVTARSKRNMPLFDDQEYSASRLPLQRRSRPVLIPVTTYSEGPDGSLAVLQ